MDLPRPAKEPVPAAPTAEPTSLVLHAIEGIEELRQPMKPLTKRIGAFQCRVAEPGKPTA